MKLTYLASPYSHEDPCVREERFDAVCRAAGKMMAAGELVYSPIAHSHPVAVRVKLPTDFAYWEAYCRETLGRCDEVAVLMLDGWRESKGVRAEIRLAQQLGKPVRYVEAADA